MVTGTQSTLGDWRGFRPTNKKVILDTRAMVYEIGDLNQALVSHGLTPDYIFDLALLGWSVCFYSCGPMLDSFYYGETYEYIFENLREGGYIKEDAVYGSLLMDLCMRVNEIFYRHLNVQLTALMLSMESGYFSFAGWVGRDLVLLLHEDD